MQSERLLDQLQHSDFFRDQIVHLRALPARHARYADLAAGLHPALQAILQKSGIDRLYLHQAQAIDHVREKHHVVIVTGTASGKTLCYNIPALESLIQDPSGTMLYIYPTKALAQDQLRALGRFQTKDLGTDFLAGTYDGDTPQHLRQKLRNRGNIVLTNPDMLHQGILPQHARWNRFFTHLKYVVIDEVHAYRGVFGSHLSNVIRRLNRICKHYGASPQFICSSATIGNPLDHAQRIVGQPMSLVNEDGSPRGPKRVVFWNPPALETAAFGNPEDWRVGGDRKSPLWEAVQLMSHLMQEDIQTITFVRTRLAAELIFKNTRDLLQPVSRKLAKSIHSYRAGFLPEDRREIERKLVSREILGVATTNALELGIDIGSLDACIIVGYPGTVASLWQQAGRAGRGTDEAVVFLVAQNAPIDQYLMAHSEYLFAQNPEEAVVDPDNPHIAVGHLRCAVHELPMPDPEVDGFGPYAEGILELLEDEQLVRHLENRWYWASEDYPASGVSLRNIAGPVYTIQDVTSGDKVIGTMDEVSALSQLHDHAVYLHAADTYFVNKLDLEQKIAFVSRQDLDYYTQSIQMSQIRIDSTEDQQNWQGAALAFGDVSVTTSIPMFKKIKFHSRDSLGFEKLELPPQLLETVAMWFVPPVDCVQALKERGMVMGEALIGMANVLVEVAPFFVMCDTQDIGTTVDASCLGKDALFLYDRYPGGMGYARRCQEKLGEMMHTLYAVIRDCACTSGCPSCVGAAIPAFAMTDLDSAVRGRIPDKAGARYLIELLLPLPNAECGMRNAESIVHSPSSTIGLTRPDPGR